MVIVIAAITAGGFFLGRSGVLNKTKRSEGSDTQVQVVKEIHYFHNQVIRVVDSSYGPGGKATPTVIYVNGQPQVIPKIVDTAAILAEFYRTALYDTTIKLSRGSARLKDSVSQNRITGRSIEINTTDTTINNTIVKTLPKSFIGYWDNQAFGGRNFAAASTGFSLKMPDDKIVGVNAGYYADVLPDQGARRHGWIFGARYAVPIRFKKKIPDVMIFQPTISTKSDTIVRNNSIKF